MAAPESITANFERRFGALRRLYGPAGAQRVFGAHVIVVGIGGVGSWAVEALARSGVGRLTLIDLDHIAESNTNRQIHALECTFGQAKVQAMRERIAAIHAGCRVCAIDDYVTPDNWEQLLRHAREVQEDSGPVAVIDACDQMAAKETLCVWARQHRSLFVTVGAAGGKRRGDRVELADMAQATHDPLLAQLRHRLRKRHGAPNQGKLDLMAVFSREAVTRPDFTCTPEGTTDGSLNCHGYGSSVAVTATFGFCAAGWVIDALAAGRG